MANDMAKDDQMDQQMDHSMHTGAADEDQGEHTMPMTCWSSHKITYLIAGLESTSGAGYALGWFATFLLAIALEALVFLLTYLNKVF